MFSLSRSVSRVEYSRTGIFSNPHRVTSTHKGKYIYTYDPKKICFNVPKQEKRTNKPKMTFTLVTTMNVLASLTTIITQECADF